MPDRPCVLWAAAVSICLVAAADPRRLGDRTRALRAHYVPKGTAAEVVETGRHVVCRRWIDGRWQITWEIWNTDAPPIAGM
jgi:hypothetical protein